MGIAENLHSIRSRIRAAAERARRDPADVRLVVVTKTRPVEAIEEVLQAGFFEIGENRVQEFLEKYAIIGSRARWHLIGNLQRNKAGKVVGKTALIHSIDSVKLAETVGRKATEIGIEQPVLLEVNVSGEESKRGFDPREIERQIGALCLTRGLEVKGLMTMAPLFHDPEAARPVFKALARLREGLQGMGYELPELSMGMTNDFEVAIEEGATIIRVGTAVFV
ncbi:MAG: YggS family pyridoxal phosphate-dependent enzyme [Candidatus Aquicultorales bacterium]